MKDKFCRRKRMLTHRKVVNRNCFYWSLLLQSKVKRRKILGKQRCRIFSQKNAKKRTKNELFWQRKTPISNNTATQSDKNIAPLWKFLNIRWRTNCNALTTLKKFAFQSKVKRRKILGKQRCRIFSQKNAKEKKEQKTNFLATENTTRK